MYVDPSPINVLLLGGTTEGKSTFVKNLQRISVGKKEAEPEIGDGSSSTTLGVTHYRVSLPLTAYELLDKSGREIRIPRDEKTIFDSISQRKNLLVQPVDEHAPLITLNLIDTPGLDDDRGRDAEHMRNVLQSLAKCARSPNLDLRYITAIFLMIKAENSFDNTFQNILNYYEKCMPNLFRGAAVINTSFTVETWERKFNDATENSNPLFAMGLTRTAKMRFMMSRYEAFKKAFGHSRRHFFIDSNPHPAYAFEELMMRDSVTDILHFLVAQQKMPIEEMFLAKFDAWQRIDRVLIDWLLMARARFQEDREREEKKISKLSKYRMIAVRDLAQIKADLETVERELSVKNTATSYQLTPKATHDIGFMASFGSILVPIEGELRISEPDVTSFWVVAKDSTSGKWIDQDHDPTTKTWTGKYKGNRASSPKLEAISYTQSRVFYATEIRKLNEKREELLRLRMNTSSLLADRTEDEASDDSTRNIERLDANIIACGSLIKTLGSDRVPLTERHNTVGFSRYKCTTEAEVQLEHLYRAASAEDRKFGSALRLSSYIFDSVPQAQKDGDGISIAEEQRSDDEEEEEEEEEKQKIHQQSGQSTNNDAVGTPPGDGTEQHNLAGAVHPPARRSAQEQNASFIPVQPTVVEPPTENRYFPPEPIRGRKSKKERIRNLFKRS